jgi:Protein of unknown function (DUF2568)
MAPQSQRRARESVRALLHVAIFGSAIAALAASTGTAIAVIFGTVREETPSSTTS